MIAPFVIALFVSAAGVAATAGILSGVLSLFQKHVRPRDNGRGTGTGAGTGGGASGDYHFLDLKSLDRERSMPSSGEPRSAGAGT